MNYSTLLRAQRRLRALRRGQVRRRRLRRARVPDLSRRRHAARPLRQLPGRARAPAHLLADPDALGPRRGQRLRAPHDRRPACRTPPRTRCCCTWRSATTRSRTSPPRSRRGRSARGSTARRSIPAAGRDVRPYSGHAQRSTLPLSGSAIVIWDGGPLGFEGGTAPPPPGRRAAAPARVRRGPAQLPPQRRARPGCRSRPSCGSAASSSTHAAPSAGGPGPATPTAGPALNGWTGSLIHSRRDGGRAESARSCDRRRRDDDRHIHRRRRGAIRRRQGADHAGG